MAVRSPLHERLAGICSVFSLSALACGGPQSPAGGAEDVDCTSLPAAPVDQTPHWQPAPILGFQIAHFDNLEELIVRLRDVDVVTLELEQIESAGGRLVTDRVHGQGARVICYTSTGYEDWRSDAARYPEAAKGSPICRDDGCRSVWPGEAWGDIRNPELLTFLAARADRAAAVGCDGIELDNIDQAFNRTGWSITALQNIDAARRLAQVGHERGLAVLAKNAGEIACGLAPAFDGVFIEECQSNDECDTYLPYAGKLVAMVEYQTACQPHSWASCQRQTDYFEDPK
jgi:hypothetical protein